MAIEPGAAVVLDRDTGRIRKFHNQALATRLAAPPGSAIKPFVLTALLQSGKLSPKEGFVCPESLWIGNRNLNCAHPRAAEPMTVDRALAYSCNNFVAHFSARFSDGEFARFLHRYGFGSAGTVGIAAGDDRKRLQALGEGDLTVTPLELARGYLKLAANAPAAVLDGMCESVEYGTGHLARVEGVPLWGKTGTAGRNAWFAGFTDKYVVVVLVPGNGAGGADAAPVARRLLEHLYPPGPGVVTVRLNWLSEPGAGIPARRMALEDYVAAVLAGECKGFHSEEALKAMAVAARTYAVRFRGRHASEGFDFCDTTHCQDLRVAAVTDRERKATADTAGELLWYRGRPAATYYSKDCGGATEAAQDVWPDMQAHYLRRIDDPFCPRKSWDYSVAAADFDRVLRNAGLKVPETLRGIAIEQRSASGRALRVRLAGNGGSTLVSAGALRFAIGRTLGWNTVRSDLYDVRQQGDRILFHGYGSGHGVGMCQLGADAMGVSGKGYRDILTKYYPGAALGLTAQGLLWQRIGGERVDIVTTEPRTDGALLERADALLQRAERETGIMLSERPLLKMYPTVATFRDSTGEPGWIAGDAQARLIRLQPNPPAQTIYHELLHVVIESRANTSLPRWFREQLVGYLAGDMRGHERVTNLVAHYGKSTVLAWVERGLPPELKNMSKNQPVTHNK